MIPAMPSRRFVAAIAIVASLWAPPPTRAASPAEAAATASELRAAFLFNFAKFTEWPPDAVLPAQQLSICVAGDNAVAIAVERLVKG